VHVTLEYLVQLDEIGVSVFGQAVNGGILEFDNAFVLERR
jgi:hypothetical protein